MAMLLRKGQVNEIGMFRFFILYRIQVNCHCKWVRNVDVTIGIFENRDYTKYRAM
jgi:hypothetical protein